jgi:hypothetical protein
VADESPIRAVARPRAPGWFSLRVGLNGSPEADIEYFEAIDCSGAVYDTDLLTGATPPPFTASQHGFEFDIVTGNDCDSIRITSTITVTSTICG